MRHVRKNILKLLKLIAKRNTATEEMEVTKEKNILEKVLLKQSIQIIYEVLKLKNSLYAAPKILDN